MKGSSMRPRQNGGAPLASQLVGVGVLLWAVSLAYAVSGERSLVVSRPAESKGGTGRWISVSYKDLVDTSQITQSGETLGEVLQQIGSRAYRTGSIQPFLAPLSTLLGHVLDMEGPPSGRPFVEVERQFPAGSEQPTWAAILRSGTIKVYFNGHDRVRVFLPGSDPRESYQRDYSAVRHVLASLLVSAGDARLTVEVFAYRNDYSLLELNLNLNPYVFDASAFAAPSGKKALNLAGLQAFFQEKGSLEGGRLDPREGLVLLARKSNRSSPAEASVTLADLAVAYRAVFYAGDNEAFVSLDPHRDPTKVTVNFGGLLEDTHPGSVVLEADKRFKTITCGLDPDLMNDIRSRLRQRIPSFRTSAERELVTPTARKEEAKWEGTRFWYYPESIVVDADLDYRSAAIQKAQFTADAERSRSDFQTPEQFEQLKAKSLSPAIRQNIDHLNTHYSDYAMVFPELRELTSVARLFGLCVWLKRAKVTDVDLDMLLSVVLPACRTERERAQLMASSAIGLVDKENLDSVDVGHRCRVMCHTGALSRTVGEVFGGWKGVAEYLCLSDGVDLVRYGQYEQQAQRLYGEGSQHPAASLVRTRRQLEAFTMFLSGQMEPEVPEAVSLKSALDAQRSEMEDLERRIDGLRAILDRRIDNTNAKAVDDYNAQVEAHNLLVERHESLRAQLNANVDRYNALGLATYRVMEIGGGVALNPDSFTIQRTEQSVALDRLKSAAANAGPGWTKLEDGSEWIRSPSTASGSALSPTCGGLQWAPQAEGTHEASYSSALGQYWLKHSRDTGQWRDQIAASDETVYRLGDLSGKVIHVAAFAGGKIRSHIIGTRQEANRIVFAKGGRTDVLSPETPPAWYGSQRR